MITFITKAFNELTNIELYQLLQLRAEVFIVEQNCPYLDLDDKEKKNILIKKSNFIQFTTIFFK